MAALLRTILAATLLCASACRHSEPEPGPGAGAAAKTSSAKTVPEAASSGFARDVARICSAVSSSGAASQPEGNRVFVVAQWLGQNLESPEGRKFLGTIQPMGAADKAKALDAAATSAGLTSCDLARDWEAAAAR
jgi:hypothetical protein